MGGVSRRTVREVVTIPLERWELADGVPGTQACQSPRRLSVLHSAVSTTSAFHRNALSPPIFSTQSTLFTAQVEGSNTRRQTSVSLSRPKAPWTLWLGSEFLHPDYRDRDTCISGPGPIPVPNSFALLQPHSVRWLLDILLVQLDA